ncbi:MAG: hypothetical protein HC902_11865 [Calothrix sp. SM1_5_4]|nr:hypothetical protein [Calothrix sp. SM1_5_4]
MDGQEFVRPSDPDMAEMMNYGFVEIERVLQGRDGTMKIRSGDVPVTREMLYEVRDELKAEIQVVARRIVG